MLDGKLALALVQRNVGRISRIKAEARMTYDVAIAGLGGIGSAIAAHCAARGASVIGLE